MGKGMEVPALMHTPPNRKEFTFASIEAQNPQAVVARFSVLSLKSHN